GGPLAAATIIVGSVVILLLDELCVAELRKLAPLLAIVVIAAATYRTLLPWRSQVALIVLIIFFIPIKRYTLPASLPFQLEPYRLVVALVFLAWVTSTLTDPRVRFRKTA